MREAEDYLLSTRSAVSKLFEGVEAYLRPLREGIAGAIFVGNGADKREFESRYEKWREERQEAIERSIAAQRAFSAERFALAVLCGSVLEVAAKALEMYSVNTTVPESARYIVGKSPAAIRCALGREVFGLPMGLIIYAGRNQHVHFNESSLAPVNRAVFDHIASLGYAPGRNPGLDVNRGVSLAANITHILGWRSLDSYEKDMRALLISR